MNAAKSREETRKAPLMAAEKPYASTPSMLAAGEGRTDRGKEEWMEEEEEEGEEEEEEEKEEPGAGSRCCAGRSAGCCRRIGGF